MPVAIRRLSVTINVFSEGVFAGTLRGNNGRPIRTDGLWKLRFGNGIFDQSADSLFLYRTGRAMKRMVCTVESILLRVCVASHHNGRHFGASRAVAHR